MKGVQASAYVKQNNHVEAAMMIEEIIKPKYDNLLNIFKNDNLNIDINIEPTILEALAKGAFIIIKGQTSMSCF
jgi:hypothetical protein